MPFLFFLILLALPLFDLYATVRVAWGLNVPSWLPFLPGAALGVWIVRRESRLLRARLRHSLAELTLPSVLFDSGRRMLAGILLLLPGLVSDLVALGLLALPGPRSLEPQAAGGPARDRRGTLVDGDYRRID